jgi:flavodoxin
MISKQKTVIIYASQTGQAKAIAESINDLLIQHEFEPTVHCISEQGVAFNLNELA